MKTARGGGDGDSRRGRGWRQQEDGGGVDSRRREGVETAGVGGSEDSRRGRGWRQQEEGGGGDSRRGWEVVKRSAMRV